MKNIVVCASGGGSTFEAIVEASRQARLDAQVTGLIVNRAKAGALGRAERLGVPHQILCPKDYSSRAAWDQALLEQLRAWQADWVVLAGFLTLVGPQVLGNFAGRVVNSHPALLPNFGGEGMYGDHVHQAVLAAGESVTGITVHLVDGEYDRGRILAQEKVMVQKGDTVATLSLRVKAAEKAFYARVLNDLVTGRITIS